MARLFYAATALLLFVHVSRASANDDDDDDGSDALAKWIKSVGGFVDPRQEIRFPYPDDNHSPPGARGIFAKEFIASGDLLLDLPWDETIIVADESKGDTPDQCGTARALRRELALGDQSNYAPYVKLLNEQRTKGLIGIPNAWSSQGLNLLDKVVGPNLTPRDNRRHLSWWEDSCGGNTYSDKLGADALLLQVARAAGVKDMSELKEGEERKVGTVMAPWYDLYNHRNGLWMNTRISSDLFKSFRVYARRNIEKGEQIYNRYGEGTDGIFRDYGFVEKTPQLWTFWVPATIVDGNTYDKFRISFWLDYEGSVEGGKLLAEWVEKPVSIEAAAYFFKQERARMVSVTKGYEEHPEELEGIPEDEKSKVWEYRRALSTALWGAEKALQIALTSDKVDEAEAEVSESKATPEATDEVEDRHGDEL